MLLRGSYMNHMVNDMACVQSRLLAMLFSAIIEKKLQTYKTEVFIKVGSHNKPLSKYSGMPGYFTRNTHKQKHTYGIRSFGPSASQGGYGRCPEYSSITTQSSDSLSMQVILTYTDSVHLLHLIIICKAHQLRNHQSLQHHHRHPHQEKESVTSCPRVRFADETSGHHQNFGDAWLCRCSFSRQYASEGVS